MQKIIMHVMVFLLTIFSFIVVAHTNSTPSPSNEDKIIATFFGIWTETNNGEEQQWSQKLNNSTPLDKVNRVYIAFADPNLKSDGQYDLQWYLPDKSGEQQPELAKFRVNDLVARIKNKHPSDTPDIFVVIGQGVTGGENASLEAAATDPNFPNAVIQFLKKHHLNGVDIDWESPSKEVLTNMVKNLEKPLHDNGYYLTLDVWPSVMSFYDSSLPTYLDQINIMSYGKNRDVSKESDDYESFGFDPSQIIGGIETESDYREAGGVDTLGPDGSIKEKAKYVLGDSGLAGMMSWRLDNDYAPSTDKNAPTYKGAVCLYQEMTSQDCQS